MKIYTINRALIYVPKKEGKINLGFIQEIPQSYSDDGQFMFQKAEELAITKHLEKVYKKAR